MKLVQIAVALATLSLIVSFSGIAYGVHYLQTHTVQTDADTAQPRGASDGVVEMPLDAGTLAAVAANPNLMMTLDLLDRDVQRQLEALGVEFDTLCIENVRRTGTGTVGPCITIPPAMAAAMQSNAPPAAPAAASGGGYLDSAYLSRLESFVECIAEQAVEHAVGRTGYGFTICYRP